MMTKLGVNVDHVATLRQARGVRFPDPVFAASLAELAGADSIVVHLREDRRHIQDRDLRILRETVQTHLNLEMAACEAMVSIAAATKPDRVTFVPERREELTTEGGLNVLSTREDLKRAIDFLREKDIAVALFIDPEPRQIEAACALAVDLIEIHTGRYANALEGSKDQAVALEAVRQSAKAVLQCGMKLSAGHGLDYDNVMRIAQIPEIAELNIGHSIISRAVLVGMDAAVRQMKSRIQSGRTGIVPAAGQTPSPFHRGL